MTRPLTVAPARPIALILGFAAVACGGEGSVAPVPPVPPAPLPNIAIVAGNRATDTVSSTLLQALTVEVRVAGTVKQGATVRFSALAPSDSTRRSESAADLSRLSGTTFANFVADTTDAQGRVRVLVRLGTVAGTSRVAVAVPEYGYADTASFTVLPGAASRLVLPVRDTVLPAGGSYAIGAYVADRFGNRRADAPAYAAVAGGTATASGIVTAGSAVMRGKTLVTTSFATDTASFTVVPDAGITATYSTPAGYAPATSRLDGSRLKVYSVQTGTSAAYPTVSSKTGQLVFQDLDASALTLYVADSTGPRRRLMPASQMLASQTGRYSADGGYIVFSGQQTDTSRFLIWRVHPDGTGLESLTAVADSRTSPSQFQPAMSPDGTRFVYAELNTIFLQTIGVAGRTSLGAGAFPVFSADGQRIAFMNASTNQAGVMNADGTGRKLFGTGAGGTTTGVAFTKDGAYLIFRDSGGVKLVIIATGEVFALPSLGRYFQIANGA